MKQESERKFLVDSEKLPSHFEDLPTRTIHQHYLQADSDREIRLRHVEETDAHSLTVKEGSGRKRTENKVSLAFPQYEKLKNSAIGGLKKTRRELLLVTGEQEMTIEVDTYKRNLEGLVTAEIEDCPDSFNQPNFLKNEVTKDPGFKNKNLATNGIPQRVSP